MPERNTHSHASGRFGNRGPRRFSPHTGGGFRGGPRGHSGPRGGHGGAHRGASRGKFTDERIDVSRFINKAVTTEVTEVFVPEHAFADFAVDARLKANIVGRKYVTPTPIQDKSIPHILRGSDVVGVANTGTGKTAAFLIPLIHKVLGSPKENVLIIVPTRELALQIEEEIKAFTTGMKIFTALCVGGASISYQLRRLRLRNQFVIGTPGRLKDLIERGALRPADYNTLVLDEADRMLDMGFVNDMKRIMAAMPPQPPTGTRQTLFFSATVSREIEGLISTFLRNPVRVSVKMQEVSKNVDQDVVRVGAKDKMAVLRELLGKKDEFKKVLVFGRTKHGVERMARELASVGFMAESIHGNKSQSQRQQALKLFKDDRIQVLVATDVAARGLDIPGVSHVINFDLPATYDDYVHRIGRTGRGSMTGKALTFVK